MLNVMGTSSSFLEEAKAKARLKPDLSAIIASACFIKASITKLISL